MPDAARPGSPPLELELRIVGYDHPDATLLVAAVQQVYVERYGGADATPLDPGDFGPPDGLFVVGYLGDRPVASGGWRRRDAGHDPRLRAGDAEVKRMYMVDDMRGLGFARRVLAELERAAAEAGARRMVLETGTRQPEAIRLYRSSGYRPMPGFGIYRSAAGSRCFAKPLDGVAGSLASLAACPSTPSETSNRTSTPTRTCTRTRW